MCAHAFHTLFVIRTSYNHSANAGLNDEDVEKMEMTLGILLVFTINI
jgi:hypothetical protein